MISAGASGTGRMTRVASHGIGCGVGMHGGSAGSKPAPSGSMNSADELNLLKRQAEALGQQIQQRTQGREQEKKNG